MFDVKKYTNKCEFDIRCIFIIFTTHYTSTSIKEKKINNIPVGVFRFTFFFIIIYNLQIQHNAILFYFYWFQFSKED